MKIDDNTQLIDYLITNNWMEADQSVAIRELSGGISCITLLVETSHHDPIVIKQARQKLKTAEDWYSNPQRIHIEAAAMRALQHLTPPHTVPKLLFEDKQHHLVGMEAVPEPHINWKKMLMKGEIHTDHVRQFGRILAGIHSGSLHNLDYQKNFADRHFYTTLRIEPYYVFAAQQVPEAAPFIHTLIDDTLANPACLVHGDYSPKNILIHNHRLILLDHEVMHFGDGTFDLGFSMTHLLSKARHVEGKKAAFQQAAKLYWEEYGKHFDVDESWEQRAVRHTIACMLARVKGKSLLEYLSEEERASQCKCCLQLIDSIPTHIHQLIERI